MSNGIWIAILLCIVLVECVIYAWQVRLYPQKYKTMDEVDKIKTMVVPFVMAILSCYGIIMEQYLFGFVVLAASIAVIIYTMIVLAKIKTIPYNKKKNSSSKLK